MHVTKLIVSGSSDGHRDPRRPDAVPMPAGQVVGRMTEVRQVAEVMASLVREADETLERMAGLGDSRTGNGWPGSGRLRDPGRETGGRR